MRNLWTVTRQEFRLLARGRGVWIGALIMALVGLWDGSMIREVPDGAWGQLMFTAMLATLILTFMTGDQVIRDRDRRVEGVLLASPVPSAAYVWGKYLAASGMLLGLSLVECAAAMLMNRFDTWRDPPAILGHSHFPPLGPGPFVGAWVWLVITPVVFGAALTLAGITLGRGQRTLAYASVLALWLLAGFKDVFPGLLDLTCQNVCSQVRGADEVYAITFSGAPLDAAARARVVQLVTQQLPPQFPAVFYWNRVVFLALAVLLVVVTTWAVERRRRGQV